MNYIQQINGFWIAQRIYALSDAETGLYFYLLNICNTLRWRNSFSRNNASIMGDLGIRSRHTLRRHLQRLKDAGIIDYTASAGNPNITYRLCDLGIFCSGGDTGRATGDDTGHATGRATGRATGGDTGHATDNINKTKTKLNQTSEDKSSGGEEKFFADGHPANGQGSLKKEKEKNFPAAKKEKEGTPHWRSLVDDWRHFYSTHAGSGSPPTFEGQAQASLKKICRRLRARAEDAGYEWTEQMARDTLGNFLGRAWGISWLQSNFLLPNLERQYDKIVNQHNDEHTKHRNRHNDFSSIQSVFAVIDAMPGWT